jgi:AraC family transcriptional regulator of adaptative response/methylated-DNA-[protein]-cysteine methyltransferase
MAREVAEACAANDLAVAVPCHRVIRTGGGISGYRWGVKRKRALLARESRGAQLDPSQASVYSAAARRAVAGR